MLRVKGILWAALSSSTFGLAPLFTLLLLGVGYSSFEVLTYRWGVASLCLGAYGLLAGCDFRLGRRELGTVFLLSLFRAATSLSLVIAYQNIASGVASTIHFMYPLVVAVVMMCFFRERGSAWTFAAIGMSIVGRLEHGAGAGHQEHRADADLDFRGHGAADRRGDRRLGFCRAFHGEGRRGHPADRSGGVGRGPAQSERVAGAAGVRRYEKSRSLRSGIFRVLKV